MAETPTPATETKRRRVITDWAFEVPAAGGKDEFSPAVPGQNSVVVSGNVSGHESFPDGTPFNSTGIVTIAVATRSGKVYYLEGPPNAAWLEYWTKKRADHDAAVLLGEPGDADDGPITAKYPAAAKDDEAGEQEPAADPAAAGKETEGGGQKIKSGD